MQTTHSTLSTWGGKLTSRRVQQKAESITKNAPKSCNAIFHGFGGKRIATPAQMCVSKQQMRNTVGIQSNTSAFRLDSVVVGEKDGYQVLRSTTCSFLGYMMPWHTFTARSKTPPNSRKPFKATMRSLSLRSDRSLRSQQTHSISRRTHHTQSRTPGRDARCTKASDKSCRKLL